MLAGCYRYEQRFTPMTEADCPPEPPPLEFIRLVPDSGRPNGMHGRVMAETQPGAGLLPIPAVQVFVTDLRRGTHTDSVGRFRLDSLPPGRHLVETRRIGFKTRRDSITISDTAGVILEVALRPMPLDGCPFGGILERRRVWRWPWQ